jgi:hypothetical protein
VDFCSHVAHNAGMKWVPIACIEPDGTEECVCIAVSHPSRLYITDNGIVTHNTTVDGDSLAANVTHGPVVQAVKSRQVSRSDAGKLSGLVRVSRHLRVAEGEIGRLGGTIEEITAEEAEKRGIPGDVSIAAQSSGKLIFVPEHWSVGVNEATAKMVVREEVIHLAWFAAMRNRHATEAAGTSFDSWVKNETAQVIRELASTAMGQQVILDAANSYFSRSVSGDKAAFETPADAMAWILSGDKVGSLVGELARKLIQIRETGQTTETTFVAAARKIFRWLADALRRLRAVAQDIGAVSPALSDAIAETERILAGASSLPPSLGGGAYLAAGINASADNLRLVSMRIADASESLRKMLENHKATRDERTVDGEPIERAGYLVRHDADMEAAADHVLDGLAEQSAREGKSMAETRADMAAILGREDVDVAAVLLTRLIDERGAEFGFDPKELEALGQKNASRAGFALREWKKVLDPLDRVVDKANETTGEVIAKTFGDVTGAETPGDAAAGLNGQLQLQLQKAAENEALKDALLKLREKNSELRGDLKTARDLAAEEKARADQEREVGRAEGMEEGFAAGQATVPPAPPRELDLFETWLMGERDAEGLDGLPTLEQVARRFITPQRWDADRFRQATAQLFPNLDENILDDAVERISEVMANKMEATRRRTISAFMDQLEERGKKRGGLGWQDTKFATFFKHISKATQLGVLNSQVFGHAFAHAWGLNGLTAANIAQMRQIHQQITATNAQGQPVYYGMQRETMERRFLEALNALLPGQRFSDFLFNNYQARVLSSLSSMPNQFSALGRILTPLDAVARSKRMGRAMNPAVVMAEYFRGVRGIFENLPFMLTAVRGESLGHLGSVLAAGHVPTEQRTQSLRPGERVRIGGRVMGSGFSKLARAAELWTWRGIRAAEGLTGLVDADTHFVETLTAHYRNSMSPRDAYNQALNDIYRPSAAEWQAAIALARQEQGAGDIGAGEAVVKRRAQEHINHAIEQRTAFGLVARTEQLNGYTQFKTLPLGPVGFAVSRMMQSVTGQHDFGRVARFWLLFGRFLGHTVDQTLAYVPGLHVLTLGNPTNNPRLAKLRAEVFGTEEAYREMVSSRATSGAAFLLSTGAMMALALAMRDDDDEEPFFAVTGSAPGEDIATKEMLKATGQWGEGQVRIGGFKLNYSQIPELAPLLTVLGNLSDAYRFDKILNKRAASKEGEKGKVTKEGSAIGVNMAADVLLSPVKRSTYRQWFDLVDSAMSGRGDAVKKLANIATKPVEGMTRVPIVVDVDKALDHERGLKIADGLGDVLLQRLPFVTAGSEAWNQYGERVSAWDVLAAFPTNPNFSEETKAAARLNVETGTTRSSPADPKLKYEDGSIREVPDATIAEFQQLAGKLYTESLLRNEADIRRAYDSGGSGAASKIVGNISEKANREAKRQLGLAE